MMKTPVMIAKIFAVLRSLRAVRVAFLFDFNVDWRLDGKLELEHDPIAEEGRCWCCCCCCSCWDCCWTCCWVEEEAAEATLVAQELEMFVFASDSTLPTLILALDVEISVFVHRFLVWFLLLLASLVIDTDESSSRLALKRFRIVTSWTDGCCCCCCCWWWCCCCNKCIASSLRRCWFLARLVIGIVKFPFEKVLGEGAVDCSIA